MRATPTLGILCALLAGQLLISAGHAVEKTAPKPPDPAYVQIQDDPALPRVLLIGDSISVGYTLPTRELLRGKANVHRIPVNGGPTTNGLKNLDAWLGNGKWDVIHFNWGLHDLKYVDDKGEMVQVAKGHIQVPLDQYEKNLDTLVEQLKKTKAKLIWCTTTPVPEGAGTRVAGDEVKYNEVALRVMKKHGVPVDDLHAYALPKLDTIQLPKNVHYTAEGSKVLAKQVADSITAALQK